MAGFINKLSVCFKKNNNINLIRNIYYVELKLFC